MSYSSILTIEELDSNGAAQLRVVTLVGPSLPFMGASWEGENELVTTWYPGNPDEGTQQNLGPKEMPSAWQGDWRRTMMGSCPTPCTDQQGNVTSVVDPSILRDTLESIFRAGRRLRGRAAQPPNRRRRAAAAAKIIVIIAAIAAIIVVLVVVTIITTTTTTHATRTATPLPPSSFKHRHHRLERGGRERECFIREREKMSRH